MAAPIRPVLRSSSSIARSDRKRVARQGIVHQGSRSHRSHQGQPRITQAAAPPAARLDASSTRGGGSGLPSCGDTPRSGSDSPKPAVGGAPTPRRAAASTAAAGKPPPYSPVTPFGASTGGSGAAPQAARRTLASRRSPAREPEAPEPRRSIAPPAPWPAPSGPSGLLPPGGSIAGAALGRACS